MIIDEIKLKKLICLFCPKIILYFLIFQVPINALYAQYSGFCRSIFYNLKETEYSLLIENKVDIKILKVLEKRMNEILEKDEFLENPKNEVKYYNLMKNYAELLPNIPDKNSLMNSELYNSNENKLNFNISYTHLGVLQLEVQDNGSFKVLRNRGTPYFRGVNNIIIGGHPADNYIKTEKAKAIYKDIKVVIAIPRNEVDNVISASENREIYLENKDLINMKDIRIFRVDGYHQSLYRDMMVRPQY